MFTISKEFHFSASHILHGLPEGHQCGRLHGHNYIVIVELEAHQLNKVGFVQDYGELAPIKKYIDENWDHRHLNDVLKFQPSAELMAQHIYKLFKKDFPLISAISVKETPKTIATYREPFGIMNFDLPEGIDIDEKIIEYFTGKGGRRQVITRIPSTATLIATAGENIEKAGDNPEKMEEKPEKTEES